MLPRLVTKRLRKEKIAVSSRNPQALIVGLKRQIAEIDAHRVEALHEVVHEVIHVEHFILVALRRNILWRQHQARARRNVTPGSANLQPANTPAPNRDVATAISDRDVAALGMANRDVTGAKPQVNIPGTTRQCHITFPDLKDNRVLTTVDGDVTHTHLGGNRFSAVGDSDIALANVQRDLTRAATPMPRLSAMAAEISLNDRSPFATLAAKPGQLSAGRRTNGVTRPR
jgi:hypothetical protein